MCASDLYVCVYWCISMDQVNMYMQVCIGVSACVKFICIHKLFTRVYAFITNIRCIGFHISVQVYYIYFEHTTVYTYM